VCGRLQQPPIVRRWCCGGGGGGQGRSEPTCSAWRLAAGRSNDSRGGVAGCRARASGRQLPVTSVKKPWPANLGSGVHLKACLRAEKTGQEI
jgi:hypothetical protein